MKILIVYRSYHRMNTQRVARAMTEATGATLMEVDEVRAEDLAGYDLVGFGSGIYGGRHHADLVALAGRMPVAEGRPVFVFSTAAGASDAHHRVLKEALGAKGCLIAGEFQCRGEFRLLRVIPVSRGHPDEQDLANARAFARRLAREIAGGA